MSLIIWESELFVTVQVLTIHISDDLVSSIIVNLFESDAAILSVSN